MNIQPKAVSRAVEESLHPAVDSTRMKSARFEKVENLLVDLVSVDAISNKVEADFLSRLDGGVNFLEALRGASPHNGPAEVAEVTGFLRARKDVEDDGRVRFNRTGTLVMRINALVA